MCFGPLKKLCHWGPLAALAIIKSISFMTAYCSNMWWPPTKSIGGLLNSAIFFAFSALTLYNFMSAIFEGPGYLATHWKPAQPEDVVHLQYCNICRGYKAPRAHHCRKCGRCVLKMDHHCPWINNCVGHCNHAHFTAFLFWAVCGCLQASVVLSCSLYRALNRVWYIYYGNGTEPLVVLSVYALIFCVFCLGLSVGVVLAVGMLLYFQLRSIIRNQTGIEDWIVEKAHHRRDAGDPKFVYPYNLGWKNNLKQVLNWTCDPVGDGITWPVVQSCDQYTLTREQQQQKCEKRQRTRIYTVVENYSGSWVPITKGWRVLCHPPFTDEPRIPLQKGNTILVTRWRRHWLFGEKFQHDGIQKRERGWFPRPCAVELVEGASYNEQDKNK